MPSLRVIRGVLRAVAVRACHRAFSTMAAGDIALDSAPFTALRSSGYVYVDKTSAIADFLTSDNGMRIQRYAFFSRPRKFGKSLTLDIMELMLAAGELPSGVPPWPGYRPVDVDEQLGGLAVHARWRAGDPTLRELLRQPHFVISLGLGDAQTGTALHASIIRDVSQNAFVAFGDKLEAKVLASPTPGRALEALIAAVPREVPVAVLIDEYDAAIVQDVTKKRWTAADAGIEALRSLLMATKSRVFRGRINRCVVTGVASFARTSLFSGANNFRNFTHDAITSRMLGFTKEDIEVTFPDELARLGAGMNMDSKGALQQLTHWYDGYRFDGVTHCFNPFPVLAALRAGRITEQEMDGATGSNWLGLTPAAVLVKLDEELSDTYRIHTPARDAARLDIADLETHAVNVAPLLLQTGLLTLVPGPTKDDAQLTLAPPNEYARQSLHRMIQTALEVPENRVTPVAEAVLKRDPLAFSAAATVLLEAVPNSIMKRNEVREAPFHAALATALRACAPADEVCVTTEHSTQRGRADVVVTFVRADTAWIFEVGAGAGAADMDDKLKQAQQYAYAFPQAHVLCCGVLVAPKRASAGASMKADEPHAAFEFRWTRRIATGNGADVAWEDVVTPATHAAVAATN